jgi:hypothetical protein
MSIVIVADRADFHTEAVIWALSVHGVSAYHWALSSFPQTQNLSLKISSRTNISLTAKSPPPLYPDTLWMRRPHDPVPHASLAKTDKDVAKRESQFLLRSILDQMSSTAFCVNDLNARRRVASKPLQLIAAKKIGLKIPDTLISNDAVEIERFYTKYLGKIIYKPLTLFAWFDQKNSYTPYTTRLEHFDLATAEFSLSAAPGIYQEYVNKAYELRVMIFGKTVFCARLDTELDGKQTDDWRMSFEGRPPLTWMQLPEEVTNKLFRFMDETGIVFGCFDMIATPENEFVFIEVNEQGQFLWVEEGADDFPTLDCFAQFLIAKDANFQYSRASKKVSLSDYYEFLKSNPRVDSGIDQIDPNFDNYFIEEK